MAALRRDAAAEDYGTTMVDVQVLYDQLGPRGDNDQGHQ
jgi:hypothetical protein